MIVNASVIMDTYLVEMSVVIYCINGAGVKGIFILKRETELCNSHYLRKMSKNSFYLFNL